MAWSRRILDLLVFRKIKFHRKIDIYKIFYGIRSQDFFLYRYSVRKGFEDRTMFNSPHFQFLNKYASHEDILKSDYVDWLLDNKKPEEEIFKRIEKFTRLFEDIRQNGILKPITIFSDSTQYNSSPEDTRPLKKKNDGNFPLYQTRCKDFEILWGHHRAACAAFLGYRQIKCNYYPAGDKSLLNRKIL
jgi:hypothetical protein